MKEDESEKASDEPDGGWSDDRRSGGLYDNTTYHHTGWNSGTDYHSSGDHYSLNHPAGDNSPNR